MNQVVIAIARHWATEDTPALADLVNTRERRLAPLAYVHELEHLGCEPDTLATFAQLLA